MGIVPSLTRLGGNITGVAHDTGFEFYAKRFELLKEAAPQITKIGILLSRVVFEKAPVGEMTREAARKAGLCTFVPIEVPYWHEDAYRPAFVAMAREGVDALSVTEANENWTNRQLVVRMAKEYGLPAIYPADIFVELGGLMAYGADWPDVGRRAALAAVQILKGTNPGDIPVSQPTKFELKHQSKDGGRAGDQAAFIAVGSSREGRRGVMLRPEPAWLWPPRAGVGGRYPRWRSRSAPAW